MKIDPNFYDSLMNASSVDYWRAQNYYSNEIRLVVNEFYDPMRNEPFIAIDDYRTTHHQSRLYKIVSSDNHNMRLWKELEERVECKSFTCDEDFYNVFSALCYLDNICDDYLIREDVIEHFFKPNISMRHGCNHEKLEAICDEVQNKTNLLVDQFLNKFCFNEDIIINLGHGHSWVLFKKKGLINTSCFDRTVVKDLWFSYLFYWTSANYSRDVHFDGGDEGFIKARLFFHCLSLSFGKAIYLERLGLMR